MLAGYTLIRPGPARDFVQKGPREGGGADANFNLAINRPESARLTGGESLLGVGRVNICKVGIHPENRKKDIEVGMQWKLQSRTRCTRADALSGKNARKTNKSPGRTRSRVGIRPDN